MNRVPILPNIITAFGLSCGLFVIFKMTVLPADAIGYLAFRGAAGILLLAALADLLDGTIARAMNSVSKFGSHFDSLADAITFGVGPAVMIVKSSGIAPQSDQAFILLTAAMIYAVCGVLRLVRFNLTTVSGDKHFTGCPIPAAAAAIVSLNLLMISPDMPSWFGLTQEAYRLILAIALIFLGYLMVSRWRFPSMKALQINVASFRLVFLTVISAVFIFYGILYYFSLVFFLIVWLYVLTGLTLSIARWVAGKRAKSLEEFEPSPDELE